MSYDDELDFSCFGDADTIIDWEDIPTSSIFPSLNGIFQVLRMAPMASKRTGKAMLKVDFRCLEPKKYEGMFYTTYMVLGSDHDPTCKDGIKPGPPGVMPLQQLRVACNVGKDVRTIQQVVGFFNASNPACGLTILKKIRDGEEDNDIARNGYWAPGKNKIGELDNGPKKQQPAKRGRPAPQQRPPKPAAPKHSAPPPSMPKAPPAQEQRTFPEDLATMEQEPDGGVTIPCTICGEEIHADHYTEHLRKCESN